MHPTGLYKSPKFGKYEVLKCLQIISFLNISIYSISAHQRLDVQLSVNDLTHEKQRSKHSQALARQIHLLNIIVNMTTCKLTFKTFNGNQSLYICLLDTFCLILYFSIFSRRLAWKFDSKMLHCSGVLFINSAVNMTVCFRGLKLHWGPWQTFNWGTPIRRSPWDTCGFVWQIDCMREAMEKVRKKDKSESMP